MRDDAGRVHVPPVEAIPAEVEWRGEQLPLEPVDDVSLLNMCDNTVDVLLTDQGPATRLGLVRTLGPHDATARRPDPGGQGAGRACRRARFSVLVEVRKGATAHRLLFDTGVTPTGCGENLQRLGRHPGDVEVIVCSQGHYDHTNSAGTTFHLVSETA